MRRGAAALASVLLVIGAVAVAAAAVPLSRYDDDVDVPAAGAGTVSAVSRPTDLAVNASVALTWSPSLEVRSGSAGLVSAVFAAAGDEVGCGEVVFEVDGASVVSYCGPRPLTSAVTSTSKGRDTDDFNESLRSSGFFDGVAVPSAVQRRDAIRFWQTAFGMTPDGSVEPGELIWLTGPFTPSRVDARAGLPIAVGDVVLTVQERLTSAAVDSFEPIDADGDDASVVFGVDTNPARVAVDADGSIVDVRALEVMLADSGLLQDGLPASASGSVRLVTPVELMTVPASSILTGTDGTCVVTVAGEERTVVPVEVRSSSVGSVFVDGALADGVLVLVDPDRSTPC